MKKLSWYATLILIGVSVALGDKLRKKPSVDPAVIEGASKLPGAADVMGAIDKQDYDGAMVALMKVKQSLTTDEQNMQFIVLARQARDKMSEAAVTNAQAAEAVTTLRGMATGVR